MFVFVRKKVAFHTHKNSRIYSNFVSTEYVESAYNRSYAFSKLFSRVTPSDLHSWFSEELLLTPPLHFGSQTQPLKGPDTYHFESVVAPLHIISYCARKCIDDPYCNIYFSNFVLVIFLFIRMFDLTSLSIVAVI